MTLRAVLIVDWRYYLLCLLPLIVAILGTLFLTGCGTPPDNIALTSTRVQLGHVLYDQYRFPMDDGEVVFFESYGNGAASVAVFVPGKTEHSNPAKGVELP